MANALTIVATVGAVLFAGWFLLGEGCKGVEGGTGMTGPDKPLCFNWEEIQARLKGEGADAGETAPPEGGADAGGEEDGGGGDEDGGGGDEDKEPAKPPSHHNYKRRTEAQQAADPSNKCAGMTGKAYLDCYNKAFKAKYAQSYYTNRIQSSITVA